MEQCRTSMRCCPPSTSTVNRFRFRFRRLRRQCTRSAMADRRQSRLARHQTTHRSPPCRLRTGTDCRNTSFCGTRNKDSTNETARYDRLPCVGPSRRDSPSRPTDIGVRTLAQFLVDCSCLIHRTDYLTARLCLLPVTVPTPVRHSSLVFLYARWRRYTRRTVKLMSVVV